MEEPERRGRVRLPYAAGIDGLRALAVAAVVLYHADVSWLPGGFLGVDVFFTISGYLICALLVQERRATGGIALAEFWRRRARRLLPGLFAMLAGVSLAAAALARDAAGRLTGDLPAAALYVSNWWQVVRGESYWEAIGRPPLLRHLWSLGVEEQFYVVAPLVLGAVLARWGRPRIAVGALALAAASAVWMGVVWSPRADASRAYFGTDTHAAPLLVGVALGLAWHPSRLRVEVAAGARRLLEAAGVAALAGLAALAATAGELSPGLYHGGFLLCGVLAAVVVAVAAHPGTRFGALLGARPLRWLGTRSYAVYLWHWPVIVLTRPGLDVPLHGAPALALRLGLTAALAELSYQYVEQPFRDGRAGAAFRALRARDRRRIAAGALAGAAGTWALVAIVAAPVADVSLVAAGSGPTTLATWPRVTPATTTTASTVPATTAPADPATTAPATTAPPPATAPPLAPPAGPVLAVGDSVLLAVQPVLVEASAGMVQVDAAVGRQVWDVLELLEAYRDQGVLGRLSALVVHLGTNGPLSAGDFERLAAAVHGVPRVLVVTVRVPRRWEAESNASIREGVPRHPNMRIVDWAAASGEPGLLVDDGVHPTRRGAETFTALVLAELQGLEPPPPPPATTTAAPPLPPPPPSSDPPTTGGVATDEP